MTGTKSTPSVMICAGEASGDLHAANLIHALRAMQPELAVRAMGHQKLKQAGAEILVDCSELTVTGLFEVITQWREIFAALKTLKDAMEDSPPDLLILVDYIEFNLKLARHARMQGIRVLFYVSPQVWAWRAGRVPKIGRAVDMMAVLFPFETEIYEKYNVPVRYVGHPLAEEVHPQHSKAEAQKIFGLNPKIKTVGILPGSRKNEIERILPVMLRSLAQIKSKLPEVQFILPVAPTIPIQLIADKTESTDLNIILIEGQSYDVTNCCDAVISACGTATLEIALLGIPMTLIHLINPLSYAILRRLIKLDNVGLPNIIAKKTIVTEFIQNAADPELIAGEVYRQLVDVEYRQAMIDELNKVKMSLGEGGGSRRVAALANEMLDPSWSA
jgi:lipid-A-disaccharide synthase